MDKDAIDTIIAALSEVGHTVGAPALEHAVQAVQISGAVGIAGGIASVCVAGFCMRLAGRLWIKGHAIVEEGGKAYREDREFPFFVGAIASMSGGVVAALVGLLTLLGNSWVKLFAPLGWIVTKAIGV